MSKRKEELWLSKVVPVNKGKMDNFNGELKKEIFRVPVLRKGREKKTALHILSQSREEGMGILAAKAKNMEKTIEIPEGVEVQVDDLRVVIKGQKGSAERSFDDPRFDMKIEKNVNSFIIRTGDTRKEKAMCGTMAAHIKNMIKGVKHGFRYEMKIVYTHFPMSVSAKDGLVEIRNFLGEKGSRKARIVGATDVKADKEQVLLTGISVEDIGKTAANIERACRLTRRDRRIFQDGIYIATRGVEE